MRVRIRKSYLALLGCLVAAPLPVAYALPRHVDVVLQPGKIHEDCFPLQPQQRIQYNFKLERPGKFNVHYRSGKEVLYPIRSESVSEQKGDYVAATAQEYCLMWSGGNQRDNKLGYEFVIVEPGLTKP